MEVTMTKEGFTLVGVEKRIMDHAECPQLWEKFLSSGLQQMFPGKEYYGLYCDYEGDHTKPYTLMAGFKVEDDFQVPEGMVKRVVPAATYKTYMAEGAFPQKLIETWHTIWQAPIARTFAYDFEIYQPDFNPEEETEVAVWIGVAP